MAPRTQLISLSLSQREPSPHLPWIANVPNALDLSFYPYRPVQGDYLLFLGRMSPDKGAHRAVDDRARGRAAAEDRGQVRRAGRAGSTSTSTCARISAAIASTSAR